MDELDESDFTERQRAYVQLRVRGHSPRSAGKLIGTSSYALEQWMKTPRGQELWKEETLYAQGAARLSRETITDGFLEAAEMAKTLRDPSSMVQAYRELGRMHGMYEADKKELILHGHIEITRRELIELSDAELISLMEKGRVIDGDFKKIGQAVPVHQPEESEGS